MTPKEAIEILMSDEKLAEIEYYGGFEGQKKVAKLYSEAFDMAIEALEKQIPKKPLVYTDTRNYMDVYGNVTDIYEVDIYECPNCGAYITERFKDDTCELVPNYCNNCGQKFDWSEEE